jgi:16S rRNA (cytosine967-C5)-methyltransferase
MNEPALAVERPDGYVQDPASQLVAVSVAARPGERVLDVCAAPGGKATALAGSGAEVVAVDVHPGRAGLVRANGWRLQPARRVSVVAADGTRPPFPPGRFDRVVVDAAGTDGMCLFRYVRGPG